MVCCNQGWQTPTRIRRERGGRGIYFRDAEADAFGHVMSWRRTRTRWFLTASPRPCAYVFLGQQFRNQLMPFCSLERTNVCGLKCDDSYCIKTCNLSSLCDVLTLLKRYRVILKKVLFGIFRIILVSKEEKNLTIESKDKGLTLSKFSWYLVIVKIIKIRHSKGHISRTNHDLKNIFMQW